MIIKCIPPFLHIKVIQQMNSHNPNEIFYLFKMSFKVNILQTTYIVAFVAHHSL